MKTIKKNELTELVGGDINAGGNDRNAVGDTEIETGPVSKPFNDDSDYEKGQATTTDKVFGRYRQNIPWFAVYSYGGLYGRGMGIPIQEIKKTKIMTKNSVEEKIEDLVKKSKNSDVTTKDYNPKFDKVLSMIDDCDLTNDQLVSISKAILSKKEKPKPKNL